MTERTGDAERVRAAIDVAMEFGQTEGAHHKTWVIDQMVRALAGDGYEALIVEYCDGADGPFAYSWDEGIAP
jgi:hypothetical protein